MEGGRIDPRVECDTNVSRSELGLNGNLMVLTLYGYDGYLVGTSNVVERVLNDQEAKTDVCVLCICCNTIDKD